MPNLFVFDGRLAATPELEQGEKTSRTWFKLIRNEFAGTDDAGNAKERQVSIGFTAFGKDAERIARKALVGDQLIITARISNNDYTDRDGIDRFSFNFDVERVEFGRLGPEGRRRFAEAEAAANAPASAQEKAKKQSKSK